MKKRLIYFISVLIILVIIMTGCGKPKPSISVNIEEHLKKGELKQGEPDQAIFDAMEAELKRSLENLKSDAEAPPIYYISYLVEDFTSYSANYSIDSKGMNGWYTGRDIYVDVRVGDYKFDNFVHPSEKDYYDPEASKYSQIISGLIHPKTSDPAVLRRSLWLLTDVKYKTAVIEYTKKKSRQKTEVERKEDENLGDFTKEDTKSLILVLEHEEFDKEYWDNYCLEGSKVLKEFDFLIDTAIMLDYNLQVRYFIDTEGRKIQFPQTIISVVVQLSAKADDGMNLNNGFVIHGFSKDDFPSPEEFKNKIKTKCEMLAKMKAAPIIEPYSGPVLIKSNAAGVFFHEVLGHRLESQRIRSVKEAETYKDKVGEKIINEYLNIFDDPTMKYFDKTPLLGFYPADEEGILAQRVSLIEKGILKGFLMFRYPIKGFDKSNGHGRGDINTLKSSYGTLVARQGNLIIAPYKAYSEEDMMKRFEKEIKKQKKEYGIIVESTTGGFTVTERFDLQHFVQSPVEIYKYYPGGKKELVRGAEFGGTPLISMEKIAAFSNDFKVFNGFCGAESGYVPVSAVAPTVLITELEIQKSSRSVRKPPILPSPLKSE